jgi:DNA-binding response OmpR family regulator
MLTGVEPDFDILDLGFDDYLTKPVRKEELFDVVERMLQRTRYDRRLQEFFALASKAAAIEAEHDASTLEGHEEYGSMQRRLETMRAELDETLEALPTRDGYAIATRSTGGDRISN